MQARVYENPRKRKTTTRRKKRRTTAKATTRKKRAVRKNPVRRKRRSVSLSTAKRRMAPRRRRRSVRKNPVPSTVVNGLAAVGGGSATILVGKKLAEAFKLQDSPFGGLILLGLGVGMVFAGKKMKNELLEHAGYGGTAVGGLVAGNRLLTSTGKAGPFSPILNGLRARFGSVKPARDRIIMLNDGQSNFNGLRQDYTNGRSYNPVSLGRSPMRGRYFGD